MNHKQQGDFAEQIADLSLQLKRNNDQFKYLKDQFEAKKVELQNKIRFCMQKINPADWGKYSFRKITNGKVMEYNISDVRQAKITFDIEKLEQRLDKELLNEVLVKEYRINDYPAFVKLMQQYGVKPQQLKPLLDVSKRVDQKKFDNLYELGEVDLDDIKGCYEVKENNGYIKVTEKEVEEDG